MGIALDVGLTSRPNYPPHAFKCNVEFSQCECCREFDGTIKYFFNGIDILVLILILIIMEGWVDAVEAVTAVAPNLLTTKVRTDDEGRQTDSFKRNMTYRTCCRK
jgi:hypothetical protein